MGALHLHSFSRDVPHGTVEIDFLPPCPTQFLRTQEGIRDKPESAGHAEREAKARCVNAPQQFPHCIRGGERRPVFFLWNGLQYVHEVSR